MPEKRTAERHDAMPYLTRTGTHAGRRICPRRDPSRQERPAPGSQSQAGDCYWAFQSQEGRREASSGFEP